MMHDWNVTRNHVVFMDLPLIFDMEALAKGGIPIHWSDDYGARLGVMPRNGSNKDVVWYEIEPCYVFHPMNSYEDGDKIVLDVARFKKMAFGPEDTGGTPSLLHRWVIDTKKRTVSDQPLDDRPADFPRVADSRIGLKHRFGYMTGLGGDIANQFGRELFKYDLESGKSEAWATNSGGGAASPCSCRRPRRGRGLRAHVRLRRRARRQRPRDHRRPQLRQGPGRAGAPAVRVPYGFHGS